jgi:hypothetical protein
MASSMKCVSGLSPVLSTSWWAACTRLCPTTVLLSLPQRGCCSLPTVRMSEKQGGRVSPRLQRRRVAHGASTGSADHTTGGVWGTVGELVEPSDSCPAAPAQPGPVSWTTPALRSKHTAQQNLAESKSARVVSKKISTAHSKLKATASRMLVHGIASKLRSQPLLSDTRHAPENFLKETQSKKQGKAKSKGWLRQRLARGDLRFQHAHRAAPFVASQAYPKS